MAHRVTEWTEVTQCYCGADGTQSHGVDGDKRNVTEVPMAHRETEGTEINAMLLRCRWHTEKRKERR